jgi:hypothetical protein
MAMNSQGVLVQWSTTTAESSNSSNIIGEVTGFSGPGMSAAVIDVTNLQSTAKEKLVGVYDAGQITVNVNFSATLDSHRLLRESLVKRTKGCMTIQFATDTTGEKVVTKGFVSGMNIAGGLDKQLTGDFTIAITGGVSWSTA